MKTLLLLRHGKSSWKDVDITDHERPLNERGKEDSQRAGQWLREQGLLPERILSSTARRARKTAARVAEAIGFSGGIELFDDLYMAPPAAYLRVLRHVQGDPERVLVVGHNPGLEDLLDRLANRDETLPTAALVHLRLNIDQWSDLSSDTAAEVVTIWRPKEHIR